MTDLQITLDERGARYGDFSDHAAIAQQLQDVMRGFRLARMLPDMMVEERTPWNDLSPVARQALTVIADKIARILSGDPNYADNWHDIQGYARLVEERLPGCEASFDEIMSFGGEPPAYLAGLNPLVVPPWPSNERIKFMAQGENGHWTGFEREPQAATYTEGGGLWVVGFGHVEPLTIGDPVPNHNWRHTLQVRPKC